MVIFQRALWQGLLAGICLFAIFSACAEEQTLALEQLPGVAYKERIKILLNNASVNLGESNGQAITFAKEALLIAREYQAPLQEFRALVLLGNIYQDTGITDTALDYYYQAERGYKESFGKKRLGDLYNAMGVPLVTLNNIDQALVYFQRADDIGKAITDKTIIATSKLHFGKVYEKQGDLEWAQAAYAEAAGMLLDLGRLADYGDAINNMGIVDLAHGQIELALKKFSEVVLLGRELDDRRLRILGYLGLGNARTRLQSYDLAEVNLLKGLELSRAFKLRDLQIHSHQLLAKLYRNQQRYQEALLHTDQWVVLERQQLNKGIIRRIASLQTLNELEYRQKQIDHMQKNAQIQLLQFQREQLFKEISFVGVLFLVLAVAVVGFQYRTKNRLARELLGLNAELRRQASTDPLTGLLNRRAMLALLDKDVKRFNRTGEEFVLAIGDIDYFKQVNDQYGHDCGDSVLKAISKLMQRQLREVDAVCRWGGEEFMLLFSGTDLQGGEVAANKIRRAVEQYSQACARKNVQVTITMGCCLYDGSVDIRDCLKQADEALYAGKAAGRNQVAMSVNLPSAG